jgi:hypothetical protein
MSNLSAQDPNHPVNGAYYQPSAGVALAGIEPYRDAQITAQVSSSAAAPGALGTVATVTPGTAGLWEVSGTVSISGTTVAAAETNNMQLRQTTTAKLTNIPIGVISTTGAAGAVPFGPIILNLSATDTVNVVAVGAATASSNYCAQICCRLVG